MEKLICILLLIIINFSSAFSQVNYKTTDKISSLIDSSMIYFKNDVNKSIQFLQLAESLNLKLDLSKKKNYERLSNIYARLGGSYYIIGNYSKSLEYHKRTYTIAKISKNDKILAKSYNNLAMVYTELGKNNRALFFYKKSLAQFKQIKDTNNIAILTGNIGSLYSMLDSIEYAKKYYKQSIEIFNLNKNKNFEPLSKFLAALAEIYANENNEKDAFKCINDAMYYAKLSKNKYLISEAYLGYSTIFNYLNNNHLSNIYADSLIKISKEINALNQTKTAYFLKSLNFEKLNNYKKANFYLWKRDSIKDVLINNKIIESTKKIEINYTNKLNKVKIENLEQKNKLLENQSIFEKNKKNKIIQLLIFVSFLLILTFFLFRYKLKLNVIEKQKMNERIIYNKKLITNTVIHTSRKNKILQDVNNNLKKIKTENNLIEKNKLIQNLIIKLKLNVETDEEIIYNKKLLSIEDEFFIRLKKKFPTLTKKNIRLITYIKIGMSNKEISNLLNIESNSVNISRYRLRKIMKVPKSKDFTEFLNEI